MLFLSCLVAPTRAAGAASGRDQSGAAGADVDAGAIDAATSRLSDLSAQKRFFIGFRLAPFVSAERPTRRDATRREGGRAHRSVGRQAPFFRVLARLRQRACARAYATRSLLPLTAPTLSRNLKAERRLDHATEILFIWGPTSNSRPPTRHRKSERESATKDEREDGRTRAQCSIY